MNTQMRNSWMGLAGKLTRSKPHWPVNALPIICAARPISASANTPSTRSCTAKQWRSTARSIFLLLSLCFGLTESNVTQAYPYSYASPPYHLDWSYSNPGCSYDSSFSTITALVQDFDSYLIPRWYYDPASNMGCEFDLEVNPRSYAVIPNFPGTAPEGETALLRFYWYSGASYPMYGDDIPIYGLAGATTYWVDPDASPSDQGDCCDASQPTTPDPIGIGSGNEYISQTDYRSNDGRLVLTRAFNSADPTNGFVSLGWQSSYDARRILPEIDTLPTTTITALTGGYTDPGSACSAAGGTYSGDLQCKLANGQIVPVYSSDGLGAAYVPAGQASLTTYALAARRPDGSFVPFLCPTTGAGACVGNTDRPQTLIRLSSGDYQFTDLDSAIEIYSPGGALQTITSRDGYNQTYAYNSSSGLLAKITDSFGRVLSFTYSSQNSSGVTPLQSVATPDGTIQYGYDTSSRLATVTYPDGSVKTYQYTNANYPNLLTGIVDESNQAYASITYDSQGRAQQSSSAGGVGTASVDYTDPANPVVTDAFNVQRTYHYTTINGRQKLTSISGQPCNTCDRGQVLGYDSAGYFQSLTDWNGNITNYNYDDTRGLELSRTEAVGMPQQRTISTTWNQSYRLPNEIDEPGRKTVFGYDSPGNLLTKTVTDTSTNSSRTWSYSNYTTWGVPQTITGPRTDLAQVTSIAYYPIGSGNSNSGQVNTVTDALGHVTTINSYDPSGRPLQITDPNGLVTTLTYTPRGWLASLQSGTELTSYKYYPTGLLQQVTLPNGAYLQYTYNAAHQRTQVQDQLGDKIVYTPDVMGNNTAVQLYDPNGNLVQTHSWVYNTLNQLHQEIGAQSQTTTYGIDDNGNLTSVSDPLSHVTTNGYDALNHLVQITDPNQGVSHYGYNALNQLTGVTDPRTLGAAYGIDALGNTNSIQSPDSGTTAATYDAAGNVLSRTDAKNQTIGYQYDALNRLTQIRYADKSGVTFTYDQGTNGIGRLTGMTDSSGSTIWSYDPHGRVLQKVQVTGGLTLTAAYTYDSTGQLTSQTLPSGNVVAYTWTSGQITALTLNKNALVSSLTWQPFSTPRSWTFANGEAVSRTYDQDGRLTATAVESNIAYDAASRITGVSLGNLSLQTGSRTIGYDVLDRLNSYTDPSHTIGYNYDANGNRNTQSGEGSTTALTIANASNQISSITQGGSAISFGYDANGSTLSDNTNTYSYDAAGRLATSNTTSYLYNGLSQRVKKTVGLLGTVFVYDETGHLIGEYDGTSGLANNEIVWLQNLPLAAIQQSGTYYVHADHLNTPRQIDNSAKQAVWTWDTTTFGISAANQNPSGIGNFTFNLRYPGQYYDAETGLYYNNARYYDPTLGRYITSDPLGVGGGSYSTYAYASGNPIRFTDPSGLRVWLYGHVVDIFGENGGDLTSPASYHFALVLTPDNPGDFYGQPGWELTPDGSLVSTLGGTPDLAGNLDLLYNSNGNNPYNDGGQEGAVGIPVQTPCGQTDTQFIQNLLAAAQAYSNDTPYTLPDIPSGYMPTGYNSNSLASGLIYAAGGFPPAIPSNSSFQAPGYTNPVQIPSH